MTPKTKSGVMENFLCVEIRSNPKPANTETENAENTRLLVATDAEKRGNF